MQKYLYRLLGINSLFSIFYILLFHKNIFSLPAHLCVASLLHGVFFVVYNYTKSYHFLFLRSLLAGLYGTIWLIFYLLVIMSNAAWGQTITFTMIIKFLPTFPHLLKSMPFPQILIYIGVGSILIINQIIAFWCVWKNNAPISFPFSSQRKSLQKTFLSFSFTQKTGIILG